MTRTFIKALTISAFLILSFKAQAQSDYIITQKGDSIPCRISYSFLGIHPKYQKASNDKSIEIMPEEIKSYYRSKKKKLYYSVLKRKVDKPVFMLVLERGKINLFEEIERSYTAAPVGTGGGGSSINWYFNKGDDTVSDLKTSNGSMRTPRKQRMANFGNAVKDNQKVFDFYLKVENQFMFKDLKRVAHYYNTGELIKDDTDQSEEQN